MTLQVIGGAFLSVAGTISSFLGILFFIASRGTDSRLAVGLLLCLAGLIAAAAGAVLFLRGIRSGPRAIRKRILDLARLHQGTLDAELIAVELGGSGDVSLQISQLVAEGTAREDRSSGRVRFQFPIFMLSQAVKKCPYCGADYPVRDLVERCPQCGGDLKTERTMIAGTGERYSMDDDDRGIS